jgi:hypothetical protein
LLFFTLFPRFRHLEIWFRKGTGLTLVDRGNKGLWESFGIGNGVVQKLEALKHCGRYEKTSKFLLIFMRLIYN